MANVDVEAIADQIASGKSLLTIEEYEKLKKDAHNKTKPRYSEQKMESNGKGKGGGQDSVTYGEGEGAGGRRRILEARCLVALRL